MSSLERAKEQLTMIRGLLIASDKSIFQGIQSENVDWLLTDHLNKDYTIDDEISNAVEQLKVTMRATIDAQIALEEIVNDRLSSNA